MTRVIFMGSPAEVLEPLRIVYENGHTVGAELVGIVSQPARPVGRGGQLLDPPVATFGKDRSIPTLQPESAKDPDFLAAIRKLNPDVIVTAAYGQILSDDFLNCPRIGTINIHPSLLPQYRGATPVPAALLDGLAATGVTILFTVKQLDAGDILSQKSFAISPDETAGQLTNRLFAESAPMLLEVLKGLGQNPELKGIPQDHSKATFCRKIAKEMGQVVWSEKSTVVVNRHRAFQPWPGSFTRLGDRQFTIIDMKLAEGDAGNVQPGALFYEKSAKALVVECGRGRVLIRRLKPAGGKEMDAAAFWNGLKVREGLVFSE